MKRNQNQNDRNLKFYVIFFCIASLFTACVSQKKIDQISVLKKENAALKVQLDGAVTNNKVLLEEKLKQKIIDSLSSSQATVYLDSIEKATGRAFDEVEKAALKDRLALSKNLNVTVKRNYENVKILGEILNQNTYIRYKAGAIFIQGQYTINDENWKAAFNTFVPIIDSIIGFATRHPSKKFNASIAILGFSDPTAIASDGPLYDDLLKRVGKATATSAELNIVLSQLRAEAVAKVFDDISILKFCKSGLFSNIALTIYPIGRGEELPDPSLQNAPIDDERRRAVIAYWSLLPQ
jgi:hypothetical protein